jgi:hypothetical protein
MDLKEQVKALKSELKDAKENNLETDYIREKIFGLSSANIVTPEWTTKTPSNINSPGIPTAFWSDWHYSEVVNPTAIGHVNAFNKEIFNRRLQRLVEKTILMLTKHMVNPKYDGLVLALGGDMISGEIHHELTATNTDPALKSCKELVGKIKWAIDELLKHFPRLFIPCVVGNHGRTTFKPESKNYVFKNYDWLIYTMLETIYEGDKRVVFKVSESTDCQYNIYGTRYLLTHGNQFRGGGGIAGLLSPLMTGDFKKRKRQTAVNQSYDFMLMGHWHQLAQFKGIIVNGSIKGYDEYAADNNFDFELPQQALWTTHREIGINYWMPIKLESQQSVSEKVKWVSWRE